MRVKNKRTGFDLCDDCQKIEHQYCEYFKGNPDYFWCPIGNRGVIMEPASYCYDCPRYQEKMAAQKAIEGGSLCDGKI